MVSFHFLHSFHSPIRAIPHLLLLAKVKKADDSSSRILRPVRPEFSRIINAGQIQSRKPVICKILAKQRELELLAVRLEVPGLSYFAANITLSRKDITSIDITGTIAATVYNGDIFPADYVVGEFDTIILDNSSISDKISIEDAVDYDDEVGANGDIDIGEIAAQYLSLEVF